MKNLNKLFNECKAELDNIGIEYGNIVNISVNSRAKQFWGICKHRGTDNYIEISKRLLQDDISDKATKDTIIHEILHTCKNCQNHGYEWQRLANEVNRNYGYNIKRTTSNEEKGISKEEVLSNYRYCVTCEKCGAKWRYMKRTKFVQHPECYICGCGSRNFKVVDLKKDLTM